MGSALGKTWLASRLRQFSTHEQVPSDADGELRLVVSADRSLGLLGPVLDLLPLLETLEVRAGSTDTVADQSNELGRGNHLAAWQGPDLLTTEIRAALGRCTEEAS